MRGGFPISNGFFWSEKQDVPNWAKWTGDPTADNYAHVEPGKQGRYSSGGRWRLSQALTAVWKRELKDVLDELVHFTELMAEIPGEHLTSRSSRFACPICGGRMREYQFCRDANVMVDSCPKGHGLYLEDGEFTRVLLQGSESQDE